MAKKKRRESVFRSGEARRLLEDGGGDLTEDERALLLAFVGVDADKLSEEDLAALDKLKEGMESYDAQGLVQAVEHMVTAEPLEGRKMEWPELKRKRRKRRSSKK